MLVAKIGKLGSNKSEFYSQHKVVLSKKITLTLSNNGKALVTTLSRRRTGQY